MGSFAQRLRDAMQSAGLKAVDLHERTGISKASISEYLSGNYEPKQKNVYRLAEALHVAPSYLMGLSEQEPPASPAPPAPQKSSSLSERDRTANLPDLFTNTKDDIRTLLDFLSYASVVDIEKLQVVQQGVMKDGHDIH